MSLKDLIDRQNRRKANGINQTYPEHGNKPKKETNQNISETKSLTCPYLGVPTGDTKSCGTCSGRVELKIISCSIHGTCTPSKKVEGVQCCVGCKDNPGLKRKVILDPWKNLIRVPQPPPYAGKITKSKAVVTVVVGDKGKKIWDISGSLMKEYAKINNADLVVLDWPGHPNWPISSKFAIGPVLEHYERIAYIDADVILRPGCINLFDECNSEELGLYSDLPEVLRVNPKFVEEYHSVILALKLPRTSLPFYLNTGIMVLSRKHRMLFDTPSQPIPPLHCSEQHYWNYNIIQSKAKVKLLRREANWQWWIDKTMKNAPKEAILHFSGMDILEKRLIEMRKVIESLQPSRLEEPHRE